MMVTVLILLGTACGERFEAGLADAPSIERQTRPRRSHDVISNGQESGCRSDRDVRTAGIFAKGRVVPAGMTIPNRAAATMQSTSVPSEALRGPLEKLREFLETEGMKSKTGPRSFADFEQELHERMMKAERDIVAAEMSKLDIDADAVVIGGKIHRRVLRQSQTYVTSAGEVVVERTLYKDRRDEDGRCVSPMELTLGVIGDFWTPRAAQQALWVVTQMTPKKSAELFERVGNMTPSKSSLDRLPKLIDARWEDGREEFERALRDGFEIPEGSVSIAISLDGVLAPIDGANSPTAVRAQAAEEGRLSKGPAGYREASCATLSFCDDEGRLARRGPHGARAGDEESDAQEDARGRGVRGAARAPRVEGS